MRPAAIAGRSDEPGREALARAGKWHQAVRAFKAQLLTRALEDAGGNRTHAARALGLQRTYVLRLIRELEVAEPPPARRRGAA